jgi:hypothetical protein
MPATHKNTKITRKVFIGALPVYHPSTLLTEVEMCYPGIRKPSEWTASLETHLRNRENDFSDNIISGDSADRPVLRASVSSQGYRARALFLSPQTPRSAVCRRPSGGALGADAAGRQHPPAGSAARFGRGGAAYSSSAGSAGDHLGGAARGNTDSTTGTSPADHRGESTPFPARPRAAAKQQLESS